MLIMVFDAERPGIRVLPRAGVILYKHGHARSKVRGQQNRKEKRAQHPVKRKSSGGSAKQQKEDGRETQAWHVREGHAYRISDVVEMITNAFVQPDIVVVVPLGNSIVSVSANADPGRPSKLGAHHRITAWLWNKAHHVAIDQ